MMRFVVGVLGLLMLAGSVSAQTPKKYALLVAVTTYEHAHLNQPPKSQYPEADAVAIGAELKKAGYDVQPLLGEKATKSAIDTALVQLAKKGNDPGVIVIGFFGHGVEYDEKDSGGKPTTRSYFCPYDCTMRIRLDEKGRETFIAAGKPRIEPDPVTLISMATVFDAMALSPAGNRVLLADCCRNDPHALRGAKRGFGTGVKNGDLPENANTAALFACSKGEQAMEDPKSKHGVFTKCVLDWLQAPQDRTTAGSLGEHLDEAVPKLVAALSSGEQIQQPRHLNLGTVNLQLAPTSLPKEYVSKSTGMKLVLIPAGEFKMGSIAADVRTALQADSTLKEEYFKSEQPQHSVRISRPFYMGIYEVTQGEFQTVLLRNTSSFSPNGSSKSDVTGQETDRFPVESVTWYDAIEFCNALSALDGLAPYYDLTEITRNEDQSIESATVAIAAVSRAASATELLGYRLPTEAEWEYACRAGTSTPFHFGSVLNGDKANVNGNYPFGTTDTGKYLEQPTMVGSYAKNDFGLYDMHGNIWEWCEDVYDAHVYVSRTGTTNDPKVTKATSGTEYRVLRGGSWFFNSGNSRSAVRNGNSPDFRYSYGFRVVISSAGVRTP